MKIRHPFELIELDLPNEWIEAAGASGFDPKRSAFVVTEISDYPVMFVSIEAVAPPYRNPGVVGLNEDRTISILRAMVTGQPLPAIEVCYVKGTQDRFTVQNGYHRYFLSIAMGFSILPISIRSVFDFNEH